MVNFQMEMEDRLAVYSAYSVNRVFHAPLKWNDRIMSGKSFQLVKLESLDSIPFSCRVVHCGEPGATF
jgi:hypothetical protein